MDSAFGILAIIIYPCEPGWYFSLRFVSFYPFDSNQGIWRCGNAWLHKSQAV